MTDNNELTPEEFDEFLNENNPEYEFPQEDPNIITKRRTAHRHSFGPTPHGSDIGKIDDVIEPTNFNDSDVVLVEGSELSVEKSYNLESDVREVYKTLTPLSEDSVSPELKNQLNEKPVVFIDSRYDSKAFGPKYSLSRALDSVGLYFAADWIHNPQKVLHSIDGPAIFYDMAEALENDDSTVSLKRVARWYNAHILDCEECDTMFSQALVLYQAANGRLKEPVNPLTDEVKNRVWANIKKRLDLDK